MSQKRSGHQVLRGAAAGHAEARPSMQVHPTPIARVGLVPARRCVSVCSADVLRTSQTRVSLADKVEASLRK